MALPYDYYGYTTYKMLALRKKQQAFKRQLKKLLSQSIIQHRGVE